MRLFLFAAAVAIVNSLPAAGQTKIPASQAEIKLSYSPVVKATTPSVVNIYAKRVVATQANPFANDPFFSEFFKNFGPPAPRVQNSLGSGVILSSDGLVVSNYHVVGGATEIRIVLNDKREFDAEVVLADRQADLAVLRMTVANGLRAIALRSSREVEVGDLVLAIGNPFGVGQTVTSGIVSGLARSGGAVGDARAYFIQTDAPINPGNSGGALVDMTGALVGINTSILTRSGGSNGIGFAIPADLVAALLKQARAGNASFLRPWAGMSGQMVDASLAEGLGLARPLGMVITEIHAQSPYARAGLKPGDVITAFDGQAVNGPAELVYFMSIAGIGGMSDVEYISDARPGHARVSMMIAPETPARNVTTIRTKGPLMGLVLSRINPAVITERNLPFDARGVVVVGAEGFAARVGFRPGDILKQINGHDIGDVNDAVAAAARKTRSWQLTINRGGKILSMRFQG